MTLVYTVVSSLMILLSFLYVVLVGRLFNGVSMAALWFIGTGFMGILLGLLNLVRIRANKRDWFITTKTIVSNLVCFLFYLLLAFNLHSNRTWSAVVVAALLLAVSVLWKPAEGKTV